MPSARAVAHLPEACGFTTRQASNVRIGRRSPARPVDRRVDGPGSRGRALFASPVSATHALTGSKSSFPVSKTTPATLALTKAGVAFETVAYDYDPNVEKVGMQAAEALGVEPHCVLKTLMATVDGRPVCVIVPSDREVSMKKLAAAFGGKQAAMMKPADAERLTGYKVGGISPFGQRKAVADRDRGTGAGGRDGVHQRRPARASGQLEPGRRPRAARCESRLAGGVSPARRIFVRGHFRQLNCYEGESKCFVNQNDELLFFDERNQPTQRSRRMAATLDVRASFCGDEKWGRRERVDRSAAGQESCYARIPHKSLITLKTGAHFPLFFAHFPLFLASFPPPGRRKKARKGEFLRLGPFPWPHNPLGLGAQARAIRPAPPRPP